MVIHYFYNYFNPGQHFGLDGVLLHFQDSTTSGRTNLGGLYYVPTGHSLSRHNAFP